MNYAIDQMMRAAEDSESTIDTLREGLAAAERERDELRERDALLTRERIAVATALDVPYATDLGEAVALRLTRLATERDTARQAHAELAAAVGSIGDLIATHGCSCDCDCAVTTGEHTSACDPCLACRVSRVVSPLLSAATAPSTVPAALVREYLAAQHTAVQRGATNADVDTLREARAALDAALARCP